MKRWGLLLLITLPAGNSAVRGRNGRSCDAAVFPYGYGLLADMVRSAATCPPTP